MANSQTGWNAGMMGGREAFSLPGVQALELL